MDKRRIAVIGLGYVGLPVAVAFAEAGFPVVGYDRDAGRIAQLAAGHDRTGEVAPERLAAAGLRLSAEPAALAEADLYIVTVPTPIDAAKRPDLEPLLAASRSVGRHLKPGDVVVYESTVYPGCTEGDCLPLLEAESGLEAGRDFAVGYSPERINPGDARHRFETIAKVVSAQDPATLELLAAVYGQVVKAGIHRAPSIAVAEAAKAIENAQRDLNIAFMNELAMLCHRLGIDTHDVLAAAASKWNFLPFTPGLVGGHCVGVDPYYLTHRAQQAGHHAEIILAGRRINDAMGAFVARECVRLLLAAGGGRGAVTVLGLTFKEDVPDVRNTRVLDIVRELEGFGLTVQLADPLADPAEAARDLGLTLTPLGELRPAAAVILAVPHAAYLAEGWALISRCLAPEGGIVLDLRARLPREARPAGITLWRL